MYDIEPVSDVYGRLRVPGADSILTSATAVMARRCLSPIPAAPIAAIGVVVCVQKTRLLSFRDNEMGEIGRPEGHTAD